MVGTKQSGAISMSAAVISLVLGCLVGVGWGRDTGAKVSGPTINLKADCGAAGDGVTNDTAAFQKAARIICQHKGGKLIIPAGTYIVGEQFHVDGKYPYYQHAEIFHVENINGLIIEAESGTVVRLAAGLRYGSFDKDTGKAYHPSMPFTDSRYRAEAGKIFHFANSRNIIVRGLEIDGNNKKLIPGGEWGDTGRQLSNIGLFFMRCSNVLVEDVYTHHHGLDGIEIGYWGLTENDPPTPFELRRVVSEYNGRQGLSWVGGRGLVAIDCKFNHTGRAALLSAPGAGVDIEAEDSICRGGFFYNCQFVNNRGCGVVADSGDGGYSYFENCMFWGTSSWALWVTKPGMYFKNCSFHGSIVHAYGSTDPELATRFEGCRFEDKEYYRYGVCRRGFLVEYDSIGDNVLFENCKFVANRSKSLWITSNAAHKPMLRNCCIIHRYAELDDGDWQALISGCRLEGVRFMEEFPEGFSRKYYINVGKVKVGQNVVVDGPVVKWKSTAGLAGTIPPGSY